MNKILAIIGAGELGKQIAHIAITNKLYKGIIYFDDFYQENYFIGYKVIGKLDLILESYNDGLFDEIIIGVGYNHMSFRESLFNKIKNNRIPFGNVIHSSTYIDKTVKIGEGIVIYPGVILDANVELKDNILINIKR